MAASTGGGSAAGAAANGLGDHVRGLDTLRLVAALWVVVGHFNPPRIAVQSDGSPLIQLVNSFQGIFVNGPAAVIVFFVISGFCIHYPFATGRPFNAGTFVIRRFLRIGLPLSAIVLISPLADLSFALFDRMAIWSLFCELIYYAAYPLVRVTRRHVSWIVLLAASFGAALCVPLLDIAHSTRSTVNPTWGDYPSFGIAGNTILGFPCWLLGARLADWWTVGKKEQIDAPGVSRVWMWRFAIWGLSCLALVLRFHTPLGYPWTLNLFAIACYFWLQQEIVHFTRVNPSGFMEWGGKWSYSIYLVHPVAQAAWVGSVLTQEAKSLVGWALLMTFIALTSYVFYCIVEEPSHRVAKALARKFGQLRVVPA